jgi:hypothetical protein
VKPGTLSTFRTAPWNDIQKWIIKNMRTSFRSFFFIILNNKTATGTNNEAGRVKFCVPVDRKLQILGKIMFIT